VPPAHEANRRLAEIENRLRKLDVESGRCRRRRRRKRKTEEARIHKAAEEDIRKVVLSAEQEIAAAAKQARRELTAQHRRPGGCPGSQADPCRPCHRQTLVRNFAGQLSPGSGGKDGD